MPRSADLEIRDFNGGLNLKDNPVLIKENEFQEFQNVDFFELGLAEKRNGETNFGSRLTDKPVDALGFLRETGETVTHIMISDGDLYDGTGGSWNSSAVDSSFNAGVRASIEQMNDALWIANDTTELKKYDTNGNVTNVGDGNDDPPANLDFVKKYHNFLFGAGNDNNTERLYYSNQLDPENWPSTNFIDIQHGDGTDITGLEVVSDQLAIFKEAGIAILTGFDEDEFQVNDMFQQIGCPHHWAIAKYENRLYFWDGNVGIFQFDGGNIDRISVPIEPEINDVNTTDDLTMAVSQDGNLHVAFQDSGGEYRELIYHIRRESWSLNIGRQIRSYAFRLDNTLLGGSAFEGQALELDDGSTGESLQAYHATQDDDKTLDNQYTSSEFINKVSGIPSEVKVRLKKNGTPNGTIQCHIYNDSGGEPDTLLETSGDTLDETTLGTSYSWVSFSFSDSQLSKDRTFHIVLETDNSAGAGNKVDWGGESGSTGSETTHTSSDASSWTEDDTIKLDKRLYTDEIWTKIRTKEFDFKSPQARKQVRKLTMNFETTEGPLLVSIYGDLNLKNQVNFSVDLGESSNWGSMVWGEDTWGGLRGDVIQDKSVEQTNIGRKISLEFLDKRSADFKLFSANAELYQRRRK